MRSPFPDTPNMRYERMSLAATMSAICLFIGLQFGSMALQVAAETPISLALSLPGPSIRLTLFALPALGFIFLGLAFLLFAIIKVATLCHARYFHFFVRARAISLTFVWVAVTCAGLWVAANIALRLCK